MQSVLTHSQMRDLVRRTGNEYVLQQKGLTEAAACLSWFPGVFADLRFTQTQAERILSDFMNHILTSPPTSQQVLPSFVLQIMQCAGEFRQTIATGEIEKKTIFLIQHAYVIHWAYQLDDSNAREEYVQQFIHRFEGLGLALHFKDTLGAGGLFIIGDEDAKRKQLVMGFLASLYTAVQQPVTTIYTAVIGNRPVLQNLSHSELSEAMDRSCELLKPFLYETAATWQSLCIQIENFLLAEELLAGLRPKIA